MHHPADPANNINSSSYYSSYPHPQMIYMIPPTTTAQYPTAPLPPPPQHMYYPNPYYYYYPQQQQPYYHNVISVSSSIEYDENQVWNDSELQALENAVAKYGKKWKRILNDPEFGKLLQRRSHYSLKSKWMRIVKERVTNSSSADVVITRNNSEEVESCETEGEKD
jgi:hypothetical protein